MIIIAENTKHSVSPCIIQPDKIEKSHSQFLKVMLCLRHNLKEHKIWELKKSHFVGLNPRFQTVPKSSPRLHDRCKLVSLNEINFEKNVSSRFRCDNKSFRFQGFSFRLWVSEHFYNQNP